VLFLGGNRHVDLEKKHQNQVHAQGDKVVVHEVLVFNVLNLSKKKVAKTTNGIKKSMKCTLLVFF
jgi:hypothetical protein